MRNRLSRGHRQDGRNAIAALAASPDYPVATLAVSLSLATQWAPVCISQSTCVKSSAGRAKTVREARNPIPADVER